MYCTYDLGPCHSRAVRVLFGILWREMNKKEDEAREGSTTETKKNLFGTDVENSEGAFADF